MAKIRKSNISFCLELHSRDHIKRVSLPDGAGDRCARVIEIVEDILLEINGAYGKYV
jgi:hypothetical protein